ncbi:MAG: 3'-5' exonuclease [Dehalococcoidia bacterium]|nr:3'-5' exonuclease [Dehalococcoidia bacterium]
MEYLKFDKPIVFFDLETTGISAPHDRIVEFSGIKLHPDGHRDTKSMRMNPTIAIPKSATEVHGITNDDVSGLPTFAYFSVELAEFFGDSDLGGFGISRMDIPLLETEFRRAGVEFSRMGRRIVDAQILYHQLEPRNLTAAYKLYCDRELENSHSADADTEASLAVVEGILKKHPELTPTVEGLNAMCNSEQENWIDSQGKFQWLSGEAVLGFGKYKNVPIRGVGKTAPGYLRWMANSDFPEDTKAIAERALAGEFPVRPQAPENGA